MSAAVVWMDHKKAKIFHLSAGSAVRTQELTLKAHEHHLHSHKEDKHPSDAFFHEIIPALSSAKEILLIGPGTAKSEFKHHLEKHGHGTVAKSIVGVETVDHPTDNQVLDFARRFFKTKDLFENPIR